ncbi:MAG: hypothetical protein ABJA81_12555, partial [Nocardioidaceae bacterium]
MRVVSVFGGQLYISSSVSTTHLATVGTGTPTTSGQTITNLPGFPTTGSRFGFFFCDLDATVPGLDTVYTADDGGQIQKYSLVSGSWSANGSISLPTVRGLTGTVAGSNVTLYVTAGSATTTLQKLTDTSGYNTTIAGSLTVLSTASASTAFRGVALAPVGAPDTTPPDTAITGGPSGSVSSTSANFTFTSTEAGSTFECSLDGAAFASCTTPVTLSGLSQGSHTFQVRAKDPAGNIDATSASRTWTVDTVAPDTTINAMPTDPSSDQTGDFTFSSNEAGSTFECSVDGGALTACTSPFTTASLANGPHTFAVRATDAAGNTDASPASFGWSVMVPIAFNGAISIGTGETITSLTNPGGLFQQMNAGTISGNVTVNVTSDLTAETGTIALNQQVETGAGNWTIFFQASGGPRLIEGSNATALINLNGADRVTFSGLAFGPQGLTFRNTVTNNTAATILFTGDASNDSLLNCIVESSALAAVYTGSGISTGNDNISITGSSMRDRTDAPGSSFYGIYNNGDLAATNSNTIISNNQIFNFTSVGILIDKTDNFTVAGNTLFQTGARTTPLVGIEPGRSSGSNIVSGNTIRDFNTSGQFIGMYFFFQQNTIASGNRIYNIDDTTGGSGGLSGIWVSTVAASTVTLVNNMISITPTVPGSGVITGISEGNVVGTINVIHNSILIGGTSTGASSWGFRHDLNGPIDASIIGNIFFNNRTGAGNHFAIGDEQAGTGSWSSNYNLFVGTGSVPVNFFDYGTSLSGTPVDFVTWKAGPPTRDANSIASVAGSGPF